MGAKKWSGQHGRRSRGRHPLRFNAERCCDNLNGDINPAIVCALSDYVRSLRRSARAGRSPGGNNEQFHGYSPAYAIEYCPDLRRTVACPLFVPFELNRGPDLPGRDLDRPPLQRGSSRFGVTRWVSCGRSPICRGQGSWHVPGASRTRGWLESDGSRPRPSPRSGRRVSSGQGSTCVDALPELRPLRWSC